MATDTPVPEDVQEAWVVSSDESGTVEGDHTAQDSSSTQSGDEHAELRAKIAKLEQQLADMTAIAKRAQADYVMLKVDFDGYAQRQEQQKEQTKEDNLVQLVKRLVPVFSTLKQMVQTVPGELADNAWTQGVALTYNKLLTELEGLGVRTISPTIGEDPDLHLHLPLGVEESDATLQGKVVKILEDWYLYKGKDREVVITPAKVLLGK